MCADCSPEKQLTRRNFLWTPPALLASSWLASIDSKASADRRDDPALARAGGYTGRNGRRAFDAICRDAWRARPPSGDYRHHQIERITIHHSGAFFRHNRDAPAKFRSMQADHQSEGWPDIAYHVLVDRHGNVYRARPTWAKGNTRTNYNPKGHLLVMCIGNFEVQDVPRRQLDSAIDVMAWGCEKFDVRPRKIGGHRDFASTACPGDNLYHFINNGSIQNRVKRRLEEVRMNRLCGREGRQRVRAIESGND